MFEDLILTHSIEIKTSPEAIWDFFLNIEHNYRKWHPKDHILLKWTKGRPLQKGSQCYAEQYMMGKLTKYNCVCDEIINNSKIVFKFNFPISLVTSKIEWIIEPKGSISVFTATTHMKAGELLNRIFKNGMSKFIESHDKHVEEEAKNLKCILESIII